MTAMLAAGFALGLAGSAHCLAMCGPLAAAFGRARTPIGTLTYHASRIATYGLFGLLAGTLGRGVDSAGLGRALSLATGAALLVMAADRLGLVSLASLDAPIVRIVTMATRAVGQHRLPRGSVVAHPRLGVAAAGVLNALLPCGLLYAALVSAATAGSATGASIFMLAFGAGTLPMLLVAPFIATVLTPVFRGRLRLLPPLALAAAGLLLIARGTVAPPTDHAPAHHHHAVD